MRRHLVIGITVAVVTVALVAPGAFAGGVSTQHLQASRTPQVPNLADRVAEVARYGRVITPSYLQQKALIDAQAGLNPAGAQGPTSPNDPVTFVNFINGKYTIWDRTVSPPTQLSTGTLFQFQGVTSQLLFDPYIIWDPGTKRFYYVFGDIISQNPE